MKIKSERIKKTLLYLSIVFFLIPVADTYILPSVRIPVTIQSGPENHSVSYRGNASIYLFHLSNGRQLNVTRSTANLLSIDDMCAIQYSSFNKALLLTFIKDDVEYRVKTGMLLRDGWITLIFLGTLIILAMILLFTKKFDKYTASDIGPYIIPFFNFLYLVLYLTHD